ncbi:MAG: DUF3526 domain-containing protein [Bacteroidota bacterium]
MIFILGIISILIGRQFLIDQEKMSSQVVENHAGHLERNLEFHSDDIGLLLYYLEFVLVNPSHSLAALSIGQRDINPDVQSLNIRTLEGQRYDTDLVNPVSLLHGNLDLSFIILFVFPLLIIAFTYNLRSEEVESGTWRLVGVMSRSTFGFLLTKFAVRITLVFSLLILLCVIATVVINIPWKASFFAFFVMSILYQVFWFALSFWVVSLKQNSAVNALALLAIWLALAILLPSSLNNYIANKYPVPEALTTMIKQRDGYHEKWDTDKRETLQKFYTRYPQFETFGFPEEEGFNWMWYYAMQHMGDEESRNESKEMKEKIMLRGLTSKKWARFVPTMHTQLLFNDIAGTSLTSHMDFLEQTQRFHERIRLFFYPKIFLNENALKVNWKRFEPEFLPLEEEINWFEVIIPLTVGILIFSSLTLINTKIL